jgi:hypothetical protein
MPDPIVLELTVAQPQIQLFFNPDPVEVTAEIAKALVGPNGAEADKDLFFQVKNRFSEIAEDETAKQAARSNLGLSVIDGGTFN